MDKKIRKYSVKSGVTYSTNIIHYSAVFLRVSIDLIKHHDKKELREESLISAYKSQVTLYC